MFRVTFAVVLSLTFLSCSELAAATRQMECREWVDKYLRGVYKFSFDTDRKSLVVESIPNGENFLFGKGVQAWKFVWSKENRTVFVGEDDADWTGPVKILSLNFSEVAMHSHSLGGIDEETILVSKIERRCRRID